MPYAIQLDPADTARLVQQVKDKLTRPWSLAEQGLLLDADLDAMYANQSDKWTPGVKHRHSRDYGRITVRLRNAGYWSAQVVLRR